MSVFITDDALLYGYRHDTTGGAPYPVAESSPLTPDPTREYVAGIVNVSGDLKGPQALPETIDDLTRVFGFKAYDLMLTLPAVKASVETLKLGMMSGEITLVPTHPAKFYQGKSLTPEQKLSRDVTDFCQRLIDSCPNIRQSFMQMYDSVWTGNKLGEMVSKESEYGPDKGKLILDRFNVKKRETWQFIVDRALNVTGILIRNESGFYKRIRPDKFVWFTWMPHDNDPRGRTILRAAYAAWNLSIQLLPQYFKALKQFAVPSLLGITGPDAKKVNVNGVLMTAEEWLLSQIIKFQNGSGLAVPFGHDVKPISVPGNGNTFLDAFNFLNQEIVYAMLLTTRATREAQFGSRADAEQGGDILQLLIQYGQDMGSEEIRNKMLKFYVRENYGTEVADIFTPYIYTGQGEPRDFVARINAAANAYKAPGMITPSMVPDFNAKMGLPQPDSEVDQEFADRNAPTEPAPTLPESGSADSGENNPGDSGQQNAA